MSALTPIGEELLDALRTLSNAVDAYASLDFEDVESAEWDAVLVANRAAQLLLRRNP